MPTLADQLRAMADPVLAEAPTSHAEFRDESGHRRPVDRPFLAWRGRATAGATVPRTQATGLDTESDPDVLLWSALTDPTIAVDAALARFRGTPADRTESDAGALFPHRGRTPIEVWTETELSCLHALWWLARERARPDWADLLHHAATWHVQNLQPDNATNHPWAIHVFLLMSEPAAHANPSANSHANPDARLYAQTLAHNCQVSMGRPDLLSAHILADAADALDAADSAD
jgi:hypothetical protein